MGNLRNVGGWGEVDLDQRAITTEDDIVDLSEPDRSDEQPPQPAPATQNGAAEQDELGEGLPPAAASQGHRTPREAPPARDTSDRESDEDFDRWVADRAPGLGSAVAASEPSTPPLASDARDPAPGDAPTAASGTAGIPCEEPTVPPVTSSRSRLRRGPLSRPLGRLARPAAAIGALMLTAGGTAIAINAATTSTPHARPPLATSNAAALIAGPSNRASDALGATIAAVTSELHTLARAVPPAHHPSRPSRKPRHHHASRHLHVPAQRHPTAVSEQSTASSQTSPPSQTYDSTPAPVTSSSTSQATAGSQTHAISTSQPAFGQNGSLGPGRGAPGTQ